MWQLYGWLVAPNCQYPNRGTLQVLGPEMRFKNYLDEKYPEIYRNANKEFYYQMADYDHKKLAN